jgi:hypothetical protein
MGMRPTHDNEKRLGPASVVYATVTLSLSSRPERSGAEGPAVPRTLRGDVFDRVVMGLRPTQGDEKRLQTEAALPCKRHPILCHLDRSAAQRRDLCVDAPSWRCFSTERTRISCHEAHDATSCAAFIKESRMKFASATKFNRKSGVAQWRDLRFLSSSRAGWSRR